jgi:hypothetical protein
MVELDIEEMLTGAMEFEKPVVREPWRIGSIAFLDEPDVLVFTNAGVADRLIYRVGNIDEIGIEDLFDAGMNNTAPVLRDPVNAGISHEIPVGARPNWPGDTLHLLDFDEDLGHDLTPGINKGFILVGITSRRSVILGTMADSVVGFNGLGLIEFLVYGQYQDRME